MLAFGSSRFARVRCKISRLLCPPLLAWHGGKGGYRGVLALSSGKLESLDVTLVALWDSLQAIRDVENTLFLTEAISRYLTCCKGLPHILEQGFLRATSSQPVRVRYRLSWATHGRDGVTK
jgi:hypothetical protein